jgi:AbrB family looped-hinge helix DNA binding protein
MITTVTGKNQITVPAAIAKQVAIHPGTRLEWSLGQEENTLVVRVLPDSAAVASGLRGEGRRFRPGGVGAVDRLVHERAEEDRGQA